jgi:hypothetical protein
VDWPLKPIINRNYSIVNPVTAAEYRIVWTGRDDYFVPAIAGGSTHTISIEADLLDNRGNVIARGKSEFKPRLGFPGLFTGSSSAISNVWDDSFVFTLPLKETFTFTGVSADEITDVLGIQILRIDGFNAASGYAKITAGDTQVDMRPYNRDLESYSSRIPQNQQRDYRNQWETRRKTPR